MHRQTTIIHLFKYWVFIPTLLFTLYVNSIAQENKKMFIQTIEGELYRKESYSKEGVLEGYQDFYLGKLHSENDLFKLQVKIYDYDKTLHLKDSANTIITCDVGRGENFLAFFTLAENISDKEVTLDYESSHYIYPKSPTSDKKLSDVVYTMKIKGGAIGALGSKTIITNTNRLVFVDNNGQGYRIESEIHIQSYMFNTIPVFSENLKLTEILDKGNKLIKQVLKKESGKYFTINLLEKGKS